ncbi:MAG TPA: hypothetical protein VFH44_04495 [Solirubrobacterales bacterium]|nr:hypothetical protein [Solirubrobacterales bacterium]
MDERPIAIIVGGIVFLIVLGGLTVAALATAELNLATIVIAAVSLFVCVAVVLALIGAMRDPPER